MHEVLNAAAGSRVLGIFAHPDDETFCAGGTFARLADDGAEIMVLCATRGEAGQIRDARVGTRRTIGTVREAELRLACQRLGITHVSLMGRVDGTLADEDFSGLVADVTRAVRTFRPHVVVTFGPDGGYGHPDHITISDATTAACGAAGDPSRYADQIIDGLEPHAPERLYYSYFAPGDLLLMERLAAWLTSRPGRFSGTTEFVHALLLLAQEGGTLRYVRDHSEIRWFPPGSYVVEQGEPATELFLVVSGHADVLHETPDGAVQVLRRLGPGEFFGELGVAGARRRSAHVVAADSLTCLVLSPGTPTKFLGRGQDARLPGDAAHRGPEHDPPWDVTDAAATHLDVTDRVVAKVHALCAYRSQLPLQEQMFPDFLLREIFGRESFVEAPLGQDAHGSQAGRAPVSSSARSRR